MRARAFLFAFATLTCVVLAAGCRDEEPQEVSTTIAPLDPNQAPQPVPRFGAPIVNPAGWQAGAPPPPPEPRRENDVLITGATIEAGPLLPRKHTYLRLRNMTDETHEIVLAGGDDSTTVTVGPQDTVNLEVRLGEGTYELTCAVPGHWEHGRFETYERMTVRR